MKIMNNPGIFQEKILKQKSGKILKKIWEIHEYFMNIHE